MSDINQDRDQVSSNVNHDLKDHDLGVINHPDDWKRIQSPWNILPYVSIRSRLLQPQESKDYSWKDFLQDQKISQDFDIAQNRDLREKYLKIINDLFKPSQEEILHYLDEWITFVKQEIYDNTGSIFYFDSKDDETARQILDTAQYIIKTRKLIISYQRLEEMKAKLKHFHEVYFNSDFSNFVSQEILSQREIPRDNLYSDLIQILEIMYQLIN